ncbi:MAG: SGNH/GDSL hydrolase family protein [Phycisphaeraceae bacterium JB051]
MNFEVLNPIDSNSKSILHLVTPITDSHQMIGESALPIQYNASGIVEVRLAFPPKQTPTVTSATGHHVYVQGKDFHWHQGSRIIYIPNHSDIPVVPVTQLYRPANSQEFGRCIDRDNDIFYGPADEYHQWQLSISYPYDPTITSIIKLPHTTGKLPRIARRLHNSEPVSIVLLGDSISYGLNASGRCDTPPYQPPFGDLFHMAIRENFTCPTTFQNLSVSGKSAQWGLEQVESVVDRQPDLLLLGFGMNDASADIQPHVFTRTIKQIIDNVRLKLPDLEVILISPISANAQWVGARPQMYAAYSRSLQKLQNNGIVLADVYPLWQAMVNLKSYWDLTGNGLNHPNDFGHRLYAQVLWQTLTSTIEKEAC